MAKTTLKVKVFGGKPPFSIKISLFKGSDLVKSGSKEGGFEMDFDNLAGKYSLMVSGPNPLSNDKKTVISIDTAAITLSADSDPNPAVRTGKAYLISYSFTTK